MLAKVEVLLSLVELVGAHVDFINKGVNVLRYGGGKAFKLFKRGVEIAYIFF